MKGYITTGVLLKKLNYNTFTVLNKERIASKCADKVKADNVVFLDAGTTTYEIARMISSIPGILVVTNDLEIAQLLKNSDVELIICGGTVQNPQEVCMVIMQLR